MPKHVCFPSRIKRATISCERGKGGCHQVPRLRTKVDQHRWPPSPPRNAQHQRQPARTPTAEAVCGNKRMQTNEQNPRNAKSQQGRHQVSQEPDHPASQQSSKSASQPTASRLISVFIASEIVRLAIEKKMRLGFPPAGFRPAIILF